MEGGYGIAGGAMSSASWKGCGTLAERPPATLANKDRTYYATDTCLRYVSTGQAWVPAVLDAGMIGQGLIAAARLGKGFPDRASLLHGDGEWRPLTAAALGAITALTGDVTAAGPGSAAATIGAAKVTLAKIANAAANSVLVGAGSAGSGASYTEITIGSGLALGASSLSCSVVGLNITTKGDIQAYGGAAARFPVGASDGMLLVVDAAQTFGMSWVAASGAFTISAAGVATLATVAVNKGGTGVTSVTTSATASAWAGWDANSNLSANNHIAGYATTVTAAGTTTLLVGSAAQQYFTGSTTQNCKLPVTSTLALGQTFTVVNLSSGIVTVQSSGANTVQALAANSMAVCTCILTSGTSAASWSVEYTTLQPSSGGTVTSVAASGPAGIVTWSAAVTTSGTLTATLSNQSANLVFAGPASGGAAAPTFRAAVEADFPYKTIILEDQKTTNTNGGTFTSGAWRTRTLNTEVCDTGSNCSLSSNQFTLDAGTYEIEASASAYGVQYHACRLQNVTDSTTTLSGTSEFCDPRNTDTASNRSFLRGRFTIASAKAFEIQHQCNSTLATTGFGNAVGAVFTVGNEVYTTVFLRKVA